jgi:hydroxyacylglutathione hydrolase
MTLEIIRIPVLSDNYIWLVHDAQSGETMVVDPAIADVPLAEAEKRGWKISQIWNTHWHPDHTGGNAEIKAVTGCTITGPATEAERIPSLDIQVREGDIVRLGKVEAKVIDVPAHTAGHIAFYLPSEHAAFVGDTLFAMGCGRLFEGTAAQMYSNMRKLEALPDETAVYCAHEYTQSNGRFALTVEPGNAALVARMNDVDAMRLRGEPTVPTSIGAEKATNPFMRAVSIEELATRRTAKDQG